MPFAHDLKTVLIVNNQFFRRKTVSYSLSVILKGLKTENGVLSTSNIMHPNSETGHSNDDIPFAFYNFTTCSTVL